MKKISKMSVLVCLAAGGFLLPGCELIGRKHDRLRPLEPAKTDGQNQAFRDMQNKSAEIQKRPIPDLFPSFAKPIGSPLRPLKKPPSDHKDTYTFNFDDADLGEVAKVILGDTLKVNYVLNPKVTGKVTLQTTQPLTTEELLPTLEMVLRMNNAALIKDGSIYRIEPVADALFKADLTVSGQQVGYQMRVIPIRYVAVHDLVEVIKPLVQEKTILSVDKTKNIMVVSGSPDEISRVLDMVETFDIDILNGRSFGLFPLTHADPESLIKELEEVFAKSGNESEFFRFVPIERINAVLAITHQPKYLRDIESWVFRLDKAKSASGGGVNVYKVQHSDAEELAATLNEIFTGAARQDAAARVAPGKTAAEITGRAAGGAGGAGVGGAAGAGGAGGAGVGGVGAGVGGVGGVGGAGGESPSRIASARTASGRTRTRTPLGMGGTVRVANVENVKIIADRSNNALIIVATPREYDVVLPVIKQLDILPLQVLIDATIVSVDLTDELRYGVQWFLQHGNDSISSGSTGTTLGSIASAGGAAFATGGLSMVYNSGAVKALLSSLATKNSLNVISSPSLMVLNNQTARINVGDQVPVQTSAAAVPIAGGAGGGFAVQNTIQYIDTGVTLEVRPRVNANGMVIMGVSQIVSNVKETLTGVTTTATIGKKEIESSVAVQDGETIVLGGLINETDEFNRSGIPWFYQVPWLGSLFGTTLDNISRTELVVLITPRVVRSRVDSNLISNEFRRKLTGIYEEKI